MSKRIQRRLKKALAEQKGYEEELERLQNAADPKKRCQEIIDFIQITTEDGSLKPDPMLSQENPFKAGGGGCCLIS